ncbi:hypothetical protein [Nocardia sp. NPDC048505]|uniref:hypothetical protein n=1 Tax=unclassified Nocardia TaxID=2637762 RepID=UPI0033D2D956
MSLSPEDAFLQSIPTNPAPWFDLEAGLRRLLAVVRHDTTDPTLFEGGDAASAEDLHHACHPAECTTREAARRALPLSPGKPLPYSQIANPDPATARNYRPTTTGEPVMNRSAEQFDTDQTAADWLVWRDLIDTEVKTFLAAEMPVMFRNDPWCRDGLVHAELVALRYFPTRRALWVPERRELADQLCMYVGEVLRRNFRGEWVNMPGLPEWGDEIGPTIRFPFTNLITEVRDAVDVAVTDHAGDSWAGLWDDYLGYLRQWRKFGCPDRSEWEQVGWVPPEDLEGHSSEH